MSPAQMKNQQREVECRRPSRSSSRGSTDGQPLSGLVSAALLLSLGLLCSLPADRLVQGQEQLTSNLVDAHGPLAKSAAGGAPVEDLDTLKYLEKLEKLDKYWSEVARPRFGRSEYKQHPSPSSQRRPWLLLARQQPQPLPPVASEPSLGDLVRQAALLERMRQSFGDA